MSGSSAPGTLTASAGALRDQLDGAHVAVVGLGRTGRAVVDALATLGARTHVFDSREASIEALGTSVVSLSPTATPQRPLWLSHRRGF